MTGWLTWKLNAVAVEEGPRGRLVKPRCWEREAAATRINIFCKVPVFTPLIFTALSGLAPGPKKKTNVHRGNRSGRKLQCFSPREAVPALNYTICVQIPISFSL